MCRVALKKSLFIKMNVQLTKTEFICFILFSNRYPNKVLNGIKTFYPVRRQVSQRCYHFLFCWKNVFILLRNLVEKPVGEQDKTHEFSLRQCRQWMKTQNGLFWLCTKLIVVKTCKALFHLSNGLITLFYTTQKMYQKHRLL